MHRAGVEDGHCLFSGAQVPPFAVHDGRLDDDREHDDPEKAFCPLTLDDLLNHTGQRELAIGILTQIGRRGYLPTLLQLYPQRSAEMLWHLYLAPA